MAWRLENEPACGELLALFPGAPQVRYIAYISPFVSLERRFLSRVLELPNYLELKKDLVVTLLVFLLDQQAKP